MIETRGLTKRYGDTLAVNHLSFSGEPGRVTGFLGPNGSGKSTTMRMILGLDRPTAGEALINGKPYRDLKYPLHTIGAWLSSRHLERGCRRVDRHDVPTVTRQHAGERARPASDIED